MFNNVENSMSLLIIKNQNSEGDEFMRELATEGFVPICSQTQGADFEKLEETLLQQGQSLIQITHCLKYKKAES